MSNTLARTLSRRLGITAVLPRIWSLPQVECTTKIVDKVLHFEMSRIGMKNAITVDMLGQLEAAKNKVNTHEQLTAMMLYSSSSKVFCVGLEDTSEDVVSRARKIFDGLAKAKVPTFALIDGLCTGVGLELALAADFRIVTRSASLSMPQTLTGVIPEFAYKNRRNTKTFQTCWFVHCQTNDPPRP